MSRPNRLRNIIIAVLALSVVAAFACGGSAEEKNLFNKYFLSSKISDGATLANIATVSFDPTTDGQMGSFSISKVGEEKSAPLTLKAGAEELRAAVDAEKEFSKKKQDYQDANTAAIERIVKAEAKNQKLGGKDGEIQKTWSKWRDDAKAMAMKVSDVRKRANENRTVAEISLVDPRNPIDVTAYEGELTSKDVTITGRVTPPTGAAGDKTYVFTMQRATLKNVNGKDMVGRWVITGKAEAK